MKAIKYLQSVYRESKNIKWPTKRTTIFLTIGVIFVAILSVVFLGILDFIFVELVNKFLIN